MRYGLPVVETGVGVVVAGTAGVLASSDAKNGRTRWMGGPSPVGSAAQPGIPRALMFEAAVELLGLGLWAMGKKPAWVDPLIEAPLILGAHTLGFRLAQGAGTASAPTIAAQPYRAVAAQPMARPLAQPNGAARPFMQIASPGQLGA